jgi:hypothetical protein
VDPKTGKIKVDKIIKIRDNGLLLESTSPKIEKKHYWTTLNWNKHTLAPGDQEKYGLKSLYMMLIQK